MPEPRAMMRKVTAMAAKAPAMAALQDKGDPTLPSLGTTIVVSVMKTLLRRDFLFRKPRALPQILRKRSTVPSLSGSIAGAAFGQEPFGCQPGSCPVRHAAAR